MTETDVEKVKVTLTLWLGHEQLQFLDNLAQQYGLTRTEVVTRHISQLAAGGTAGWADSPPLVEDV